MRKINQGGTAKRICSSLNEQMRYIIIWEYRTEARIQRMAAAQFLFPVPCSLFPPTRR